MDEEELRKYRQEVLFANHETFELAKQRDIHALIGRLQSPLETENIVVRFAALSHLGRLGAREAIPHVLPLLEDDDPRMRAGAIVALGRLDARDATSRIVKALDDPSPGVRQRAAENLGALGTGDPSVVAALGRALDDDVWHIRREALASLAGLGDASAIPAIEAAARKERLWRRGYARRALRALHASRPGN